MNTEFWVMDDFIGQYCDIFCDPITKKDHEGIAVLIKPVKFENDDNLSIWMVAFTDAPSDHYQRTIDRKDIIE